MFQEPVACFKSSKDMLLAAAGSAATFVASPLGRGSKDNKGSTGEMYYPPTTGAL